MTPASALYTGTIAHARFTPVLHRFRYKLFMTALNLEALTSGALRGWLDPTRRFALVRFNRSDHLGDAAESLLAAAQSLVKRELPDYAPGPIVLLTHLRQFGYRFNPVSFYFCFAPDGATLNAIVLEVNNTPWGEQHCYVLDCAAQTSPYTFQQGKRFAVSPFLGMDLQYRFRFELAADVLRIHMANWRGDTCLFNALLDMRAQPLTVATLTRALSRYPLMTWKVTATIYWQALRLILKGVPFLGYQKPVTSGASTAAAPLAPTPPARAAAHASVSASSTRACRSADSSPV